MKLPTGQTVTQVHAPSLAAPKPSSPLPAAIVPLHASVAAPVVTKALKVAPHVANKRPRVVGRVTVSTVEQFDSVRVGLIPRSALFVAGYVNGLYRTYPLLVGRWPHVLGISVFTSGGADCLDMEPGNPGPSSAGPWAKWQFTQGNPRPCEYSMLSWFPAINKNLRANGVSVCATAYQSHCVREWDANWTNVRHVDSGFMCTQWTDHAYNLNLDESTCLTSFYAPLAVPARRVVHRRRRRHGGYSIYPTTRFRIGHTKASERNTVRTWDRARCKNPVRRGVCRSSRAHMILLRRRVWFVAHHRIVRGRWVKVSKARWSVNHLGARFQGLSRRLK